jgi:hypothetical protein
MNELYEWDAMNDGPYNAEVLCRGERFLIGLGGANSLSLFMYIDKMYIDAYLF